ncbi:MAG: hypothetical protein R3C16_11855 [Hyphomonadaceae bacterium]
MPGVATSSEIMLGLELGYTHFKPSSGTKLGGVSALKAQAGPCLRRASSNRLHHAGESPRLSRAGERALRRRLVVMLAEKIKAQDWADEAAARQAAALRR